MPSLMLTYLLIYRYYNVLLRVNNSTSMKFKQ